MKNILCLIFGAAMVLPLSAFGQRIEMDCMQKLYPAIPTAEIHPHPKHSHSRGRSLYIMTNHEYKQHLRATGWTDLEILENEVFRYDFYLRCLSQKPTDETEHINQIQAHLDELREEINKIYIQQYIQQSCEDPLNQDIHKRHCIRHAVSVTPLL